MLCLVFPDDHLLARVLGVRRIGKQFEIVLHAIGGISVVVQLGTNEREIEPALRPSIECCQPVSVFGNRLLPPARSHPSASRHCPPEPWQGGWQPRSIPQRLARTTDSYCTLDSPSSVLLCSFATNEPKGE